MSSTPEAQLRAAGLRITAGRLAVIAALETHPHSDADTLWGMIRKDLPGISVQSVHNVLHDLSDAGLLRRIEPAGSSSRYERRLNDNHHHVVCTQCGRIADVDCVHGEAPCLTPSNTAGFVIDTAEVTFWGVCPECVSANAALGGIPVAGGMGLSGAAVSGAAVSDAAVSDVSVSGVGLSGAALGGVGVAAAGDMRPDDASSAPVGTAAGV